MKDEKELKIKVAEAAMKAFNEKGIKFRMDDVAAMLQMSKKTLYRLYDSKEQLILKAVDMGFGAVMEKKQAIIDDPDIGLVEKIKRVIIAIPDRYQTVDWRRLHEFRDSFPEAYAKIQYYLQNNWDGTLDLVKQAIDAGLIKDIDLTVFRCMLESAFESFIGNTALLDAGVTHDEALNTMLEIAMYGIVTEKGKTN